MNEIVLNLEYFNNKIFNEEDAYTFCSVGFLHELSRQKQMDLLNNIRLYLTKIALNLGKIRFKANGGPTISDWVNAITSLIPEEYLLVAETLTFYIAASIISVLAYKFIQEKKEARREALLQHKLDLQKKEMELRGIEPLTSCMPCKRSPS